MYEIEYYSCKVEEVENKKESFISIIHENSEKDFTYILSYLRKKAKEGVIKWYDYLKFFENFARVKYNHALTIHKMQGSTYKTTILNVRNMFLNKNLKERERLLYTAVTRASNNLILYV
jgi:exodeoxyribonuclease-5